MKREHLSVLVPLALLCMAVMPVSASADEPVTLIGTIVKWRYPDAEIGRSQMSDAATMDADRNRTVPSTVLKTTMPMAANPTLETDFRRLPLAETEAIVARFNERVGAAQQANPATKDWVRKAVKRAGGRRCPVRLKRLSLDVIVRYGDALADLFCEYPDDLVAVIPYEWTIGY